MGIRLRASRDPCSLDPLREMAFLMPSKGRLPYLPFLGPSSGQPAPVKV